MGFGDASDSRDGSSAMVAKIMGRRSPLSGGKIGARRLFGVVGLPI